jgi:hypothetical protein
MDFFKAATPVSLQKIIALAPVERNYPCRVVDNYHFPETFSRGIEEWNDGMLE